MITLYVNDRDYPKEFEVNRLKENGSIYIPDFKFEELIQPNSVINRIYDDDVNKMFKKME